MKVSNAKKIGAARSAGFTIIELIVVILLLGILTATALPRFLDVTDQAYDAAVDGVLGGLATGVGLWRAGWVAGGQVDAAAVSAFGSGTLFAGNTTTGTGYPVGTNAAFTNAGDCGDVFELLLQPSGRPGVEDATAASGAAAVREAAVEGAALSNGETFVAIPNTAEAAKTGCLYYYVGRFTSGSSDAQRTIPFIQYDANAGTMTLGSQLFDQD